MSLEFFRKKPILPDGKTVINDVPYYSQRLYEDNYKKEGFSNLEEAKYWSERICGIACLKMALCTFLPDRSFTLKVLLDKGLEIGAYREDVGWIHRGLVQLGKHFGIDGDIESVGQNLERIAEMISQGKLVVPSVGVGFEEDEKYRVRGGHLVTIFGFESQENRVNKLVLHHPSSWQSYEWPAFWIDKQRFLNSFSMKGNLISFWKKK